MDKRIFHSRQAWSFVVVLFIVACLFYGVIAFQMGSSRSGRGDESIYINMARSFHYNHNFLRGGASTGSTSVIYSILLSVCYYFYAPEHILLSMRLVNVLVMCSVVFPVYLLAYSSLNDRRKSLFAALISVVLPSMTLTYYMYQEVLLYPVALWFFYYYYQNIESQAVRTQITIGAFLYLLYIVKTAGAYFFVAHLLILIINARHNWKVALRNMLLTVAVFLVLFYSIGTLINLINGEAAIATISDPSLMQKLWFYLANFPYYFLQFIRGIAFYSFYTLVSVLAFPVLIPLFTYIKYEAKNRRFLMFCLLYLAVSIVLTTVIIFLNEDATRSTPRFHSRYYFSVFIPLIVLALKADLNHFHIHPMGFAGLAIVCVYPFVTPDGMLYFSSFVDNYLFSIFEGVTLFAGKYANILLALFFVAFAAFIIFLHIQAHRNKLRLIILSVILLVYLGGINLVDNAIILVYRHTSIMEQQVDYDSMALAQFLNDNDGLSAFIDVDSSYSRVINYNTQLKDDYYYYYTWELKDNYIALDPDVRYIIIPDTLDAVPANCEVIDIGLHTAALYKLNTVGQVSLVYS